MLCISVSNLTLGLVTGRASLSIGTCYAFDTSSAISLFITFQCLYPTVPSVLCRCWLGDRKGIWPVKTEWWGDGMVVCLERGADLHMAQLMPLPLNVSCFSKIQIGFTFLVPAHTGSPRKRAVKRVCVCVPIPQSFSAEPCERKKPRWG